MNARLDHLVILVFDLERAAEDYGRLGFTVTPGGGHADGLTRNALVPFPDGTYLELVHFVDPEDPRDNVWGWRRFAASGGGLIDFCAAAEDLERTIAGLRGAGLAVEGPDEGGRTLPDGREIRWLVARVRQRGRVLPFLIQDLTDRALRVPSGPAASHANGATGISRLRVAATDVGGAVSAYRILTGVGLSGGNVKLGASLSVEIVGAGDAKPGPLAVAFAGLGGEYPEPGLLHGLSIL